MESERKVFRVNLSDIVPAPYQPQSRLDNFGQLKKLEKSIHQYGLLYPILVSQPDVYGKYQVIDGHRRLKAAESLKWPVIDVIISEKDLKPADLFSTVCGNSLRMTNTAWIEVYLSGGIVENKTTLNQVIALESLMGRNFLEDLIKKNMSTSIWILQNRVIKYIGIDDSDTNKKQVLQWLLNVGSQVVHQWTTNGYPSAELRKAFKENRKPRV